METTTNRQIDVCIKENGGEGKYPSQDSEVQKQRRENESEDQPKSVKNLLPNPLR